MGQTIRRQPGSVDVPTKDYIYHKNLIGFKGLDTRENPLVTDPLSCSDAKNVWVDENGNLTQRPRLQWVRRDLKVQDSDVVNVIYTDKAYWTLYYKDGTYSLTRTDLTTSTVTLFTIPEITSPKIGITEFQGTYYLGCSSGYYSCVAGQTQFTAVTGYVPVGTSTDTGIIYKEPRNILNSNVRIATKFADTTFEAAGATPLLEKMYCGGCLLSSSFSESGNVPQLLVTIYDMQTQQRSVISCPANVDFGVHSHYNYAVRCGFTAFYSNNTLHIVLVALDSYMYISTWATNPPGDYGNIYLAIRHYEYTNGKITCAIPSGANATGWLTLPAINPGYANIMARDNVFSGKGRIVALKALQANKCGININFVYAQSTGVGRVRGDYIPQDGTNETSEQGQYVEQGVFYTPTPGLLFLTHCGYTMTAYMAGAYDFIPAYTTYSGAAPQFAFYDDHVIAFSNKSALSPDATLQPINNTIPYTAILSNIPDTAYYRGTSKPLTADVIFAEYTAENDADIYSIMHRDTGEYIIQKQKYSTLSISNIDNLYTGIADNYFLNSMIAVTADKQTYTRALAELYVLFQIQDASALQIIIDKRGIVIWTGIYNKLLIPNSNSSTKSWFTFENNVGALSVDDLTVSFIQTEQTWRVVIASETEVPSIRGVLFLDNVYWWFGETNIYGTMNDDLTYLPETRKLDAPSKILNWVRLTDTSFIVFCESDTVIYYKDSSSNLWLRTVLNLPFEIISPDETSEACYAALNTGPTYVTRNGIYEIALSENLFTNERQAQNISMTLATLEGGLLQKIIPNLLHIQTVRYKDWQLFVFKRQAGFTEVIAQEISTYNYFYWTLPIDFVSTYLAEGEVYLVDKNAITYKLTETELLREYKNGDTVIASVKCYGDEVFNETEQTTELKQIDWFWHSAVLNLDTVQYYKTLLALIFGMNDYDDASRVMFEYQTDIYYKSHTEQPIKVYDDYVYKIRNTQKQAPIPRFMYIRVRCESVPIPDAPDCLPEEFMCKVNLSQITFKYKVLRGSLL